MKGSGGAWGLLFAPSVAWRGQPEGCLFSFKSRRILVLATGALSSLYSLVRGESLLTIMYET
jgi:hypothetical protein